MRVAYEQAVEELRIPPPSVQPNLWENFNRLTGGLREKEFSIVCAPTGCGKTEWLASLSKQLLTQRIRHFVMSVETGHTDWVKRVMSGLAGLDLNTGEAVSVPVIADVTTRFAPLIVEDILRLSLYDNRVPLQTLIADLTVMANEGCKVAILDNLNFFLEIVRASDSIIEMDRVVHELIMFCKRSTMHVILVMHPRKTLDGRVESEFDVKGSSTAVQEAQNVFLFNRPKKEDLEARIRDPFCRELKLAKMRRRGRFVGSTVVFRYRDGQYIEEGIG
jgi:hypothetical protein